MKLSSLIGRVVVEQGGRGLGHVFDVEVKPKEHGLEIVALSVGRTGVLERLGLQRGIGALAIDWGRVVEVREGRIVVRRG
jgi:sporulation protein YlmC with PRC-barrel domain